jgi:hypothetical protein
MNPLSQYFTSRVRRGRDVVSRATAGPLLIRLVVWALAAAGLMLAYPAEVARTPQALPAVLLVAVLPAAFARTRMVSLLLFAIALGWMVSTTVFADPIATWRLITLAALLYLLHTTAALAAVLPYDTVVARAVLAGWLLRALAVVAATTVFGVASSLGADRLAGHSYLVAALVGVALVCLISYLLVRASRTHPDGN